MGRYAAILTVLLVGCTFGVDGVSGVGGGSGTLPGGPSPGGTSQPSDDDAGVPPDLLTPADPPDLAPMPGRVGDACDDKNPCGAFLTCLHKLGTGPKELMFPGGYCTRNCENTSCPSGSECADIAEAKYCLVTCPTNTCRKDYSCCDASGGKVCMPGLCS